MWIYSTKKPLGTGGDGPIHPSSIQAGDVDGRALCRMFNRFVSGTEPSRHLSSDHDPLFEYHRWRANRRILETAPIKSVPDVPFSQSFVERLIGTSRREFLDQTLSWNAVDLEKKLGVFQEYYSRRRVHASLKGDSAQVSGASIPNSTDLKHYRWQAQCHGLAQIPLAAQ